MTKLYSVDAVFLQKNEQADLLGVYDVQRCVEEAPFKVSKPLRSMAMLNHFTGGLCLQLLS